MPFCLADISSALTCVRFCLSMQPFRCAHCHYSCNIAGPLKRHYNMKHPDQKYQNAGPGLPNPDALKQQGLISALILPCLDLLTTVGHLNCVKILKYGYHYGEDCQKLLSGKIKHVAVCTEQNVC